MKFAIDRIKISSEEEVHAASFYGSYIPQRKTRFFCPECGEQVFWSSRGGIQPDKFNHYTKTVSSPECDKRVDGRSELSLYERVGLPMSLEQVRESIFRLNIVFPAIGEQPLEMAAKQNYKICVSSADQKRIFPIDFTYFQADAATLIPVDFVPLQGANYRIQIDAGDEIKKRWSDYSDGFAQGGAIFTYEEVGGKKVKRGDCIATGRQYYVVARQFCSPYGEIQSECVGSIQLNESPYSVYTVSVDVSPEDGNRYAVISKYLKSLFGVWLLETAPGLTALWPPVTEQDVFVPIKNTPNLYCTVSSGNAVPKVYTYTSNTVSPLTVNPGADGVHTLVLSVHGETVVSVDRKYIGREIVFQKKSLAPSDCAYEMVIERQDGGVLDLDALTSPVASSELVLTTNAKMELYIGSRDKTYLHVPIRDPMTAIPARRNSVEIVFGIEGGVIRRLEAKARYGTKMSTRYTIRQIREGCIGGYVPAPQWIGGILSQWQKTGHHDLVSAVKSAMQSGKIPFGLLCMLQKHMADTAFLKGHRL